MARVVIAAIFMLVSFSAQAKQLFCFSKYFSGGRADLQSVGQIVSDVELRNFDLRVNNDSARSATQLLGTPHSGHKYKNMIRFVLQGPGVTVGNNWQDISMRLLLPAGFSSVALGGRFGGIIILRADNGGGYDRVFCRIIRD